MSLYNERYDEALSKAQWVSKACGGRTYLFKYAPHPERKGYLFAATDLETVTFEELSATSVPTRLGNIAAMDGEEDPMSGLGYSAQQARSEEALKTLAGVFEHGWAKAEVERDVDDYFDAVFVVKHDSFKWLFQMTELRGRQPLSFISKQLLAPWASLLAQDRGVSIDPASPVAAVGAIISDPGVARALRRVTGAGPPRPTPTPGPPTRRSSPAAPTSPPPPTKIYKPPPSPSPARTPPRALSPERTPLPRPRSPSRTAGHTGLAQIPPSSPTPVARRKAYDFAAGILPSSEPDHSEELDVADDDVPVTGRTGFPSAPADQRHKPGASLPSSPPVPPHELMTSSDAAFPAHTTSEHTSSNVPSSTQDPLIPTQEHKKKKKKKKDPKKLEEEEEAEASRRREEMKKRMASGGGGGRLGRRRA